MTDLLLALPVAWVELDHVFRIIRVNAELERLLGLPAAELTGQPLTSILPISARLFFQTHVLPSIVRGARIDEVYLSVRTKTGVSVPVHINAVRVDAPAPESPARFLIAMMPTHRRQFSEGELLDAKNDAAQAHVKESEAQARVSAVEAQLAIAERLASIGTLAAAVAHEINNPLAYVAANADLLGNAIAGVGLPNAEMAALVTDIQDGVARIREIVSSLKIFSRMDDPRRVPVDVSRVIDASLRIAGTEIKHRARLEVDIESPLGSILAEEGRLGQVLINLLVNAAQALGDGARTDGVVTIRARRVEGQIEIRIEDNGPGIPPELQRRIFDPFFTTKPVGQGTGLGLAVCHGIVTALEGTIEVVSEVGRGATFVIRLPALPLEPANECETPREPVAPVAEPVPAPVHGVRPNISVLLVDDEEPVARTLMRVLRDFDVTWCNRSTEAWAKLRDGGANGFDVILCDLMMPEMSGIDLYQKLNEVAPAVAARMIFMTGGAFTEGARRFLEEIPNPTLAKPFDLKLLRRTVERCASSGPERD